ncbi:hypothetical protein [Muricoccus radiodurans]|uniref:hypothetical protein n=1 Tax=Muricoccus radiodurans TaxID=2231721 RepID=UPI003CEBE193
MIWLAAGAALLLLALVGLQGFATASVAQVRAVAAWTLAFLGVALVVLLLLTERAGQLFWALALFGPVLWRRWQGRRAAATFGAPAGGAADTVETAMLSMRLDPASGTLSGAVRQGRQAGRDLASLSLEEARALLEEAGRDDPDSVPLLEAWLDRAHPGWRAAGAAPPPSSGAMERAEALAILGLTEGADKAAIRAAHARLMRAAHPDAGGSDWLAARLNAARDLLLG